MKCAVITPIGPGHIDIYALQCATSIKLAAESGMGLFSDVKIISIDDSHGLLGRSLARNMAVEKAHNAACEWCFFLDADDILHPDAFIAVGKYLRDFDAIWGLIVEAPYNDISSFKFRPKQATTITEYKKLLQVDPFLSLQMGHFVKTEVARKFPFDTQMDCAEDFDYYLRVWKSHKCAKVEDVFFINVRGNHSTGPRSSGPRDWVLGVNKLFVEARADFQDDRQY